MAYVQHFAKKYDETLQRARVDTFLGIFVISLDNIDTGEKDSKEFRAKVRRLEGIFDRQGCLHKDPENYVSLRVEAQQWTTISQQLPGLILPAHLPRDLPLGAGQRLYCLQGKARIVAAKAWLRNDRWWIAKLYRKDPADARNAGEQRELFSHIENEVPNEKPPSDARLVAGIQQNTDPNLVSQFWANLTPHKAKCFRRLRQRSPLLATEFERCLRFPFLQVDFHIGTLHKLVAGRCDEEIHPYLQDLFQFWGGVSARNTRTIPEAMVTDLQGRCPKYSEHDRQHLQELIDGNSFDLNHDERAEIFAKICEYPYTVPSFATFFSDVNYILILSDILKYLLWPDKPPKEGTVRQAFRDIFCFENRFITQTGHVRYQRYEGLDKESGFLWSYCQVWLIAMRLWAFTYYNHAPRKRQQMSPGRYEKGSNTSYWALMAKTVMGLGFISERLANLSSLDSAAEIPILQPYTGFFVAEGTDSDLSDRCGIPFDDVSIQDRDSLFISEILERHGTGQDLSPFFVRRVLFLRLFPEAGQWNDVVHSRGIFMNEAAPASHALFSNASRAPASNSQSNTRQLYVADRNGNIQPHRFNENTFKQQVLYYAGHNYKFMHLNKSIGLNEASNKTEIWAFPNDEAMRRHLQQQQQYQQYWHPDEEL